MDRFNAFWDANIFIGAKYNFVGGSLGSLKKYCENRTAVLFKNDIILREVQHHMEETLLNATASLHAQFDVFMNGATTLSNEGLSVIDLFNAYLGKSLRLKSVRPKSSNFQVLSLL